VRAAPTACSVGSFTPPEPMVALNLITVVDGGEHGIRGGGNACVDAAVH